MAEKRLWMWAGLLSRCFGSGGVFAYRIFAQAISFTHFPNFLNAFVAALRLLICMLNKCRYRFPINCSDRISTVVAIIGKDQILRTFPIFYIRFREYSPFVTTDFSNRICSVWCGSYFM